MSGGGFQWEILGALFPERASRLAERVDLLFLGLLAISGLILLSLFALLVLALFHYEREDDGLGARLVRHQHKIEAAWFAIPFLIFLFLFGWGAWLYLDPYDVPEGASEVHVTARQWMWQTYYTNGYTEHNTVHLLVDQPVAFILSSEDVIHSFYVPAFRVKRDVVPGKFIRFTLTPTRTGRFRLFCAEYCGSNHSSMTGWVEVMDATAYAAWQDSHAADESLAARGQRLYHEQGCAGCHEPGSTVHAPDLHGLAGGEVPLQSGEWVDADTAYLRDSILVPGKRLAAGYDNLMPTYAGKLREDELAALIVYLQSLPPRPSTPHE